MTVITLAEIDNRFDFHPADTEQRRTSHEHVRQLYKDLAYALIGLGLVPQGRELALAVTHLEDSLMWANAGIARHGPQGAFVTS